MDQVSLPQNPQRIFVETLDKDRVSVVDIGVGAEEEIEMIIIVMITGIDTDGGRETEVQFIKIGEIRLVVMMTGEQALAMTQLWSEDYHSMWLSNM